MPKRWNRRSATPSPGRKWNAGLVFGIILLMLTASLVGCGSVPVAKYDPAAYDNDVRIKNQALYLINCAIEEYSGLQNQAQQEYSSLQVEALKGFPILQDPTIKKTGLQPGTLNAYRDELELLKSDLTAVYEAEKSRDHNELTIKMWEIINDPNQDFLGGLIEKWRKDTSLLEDYLQVKTNSGNLELMENALKKWLDEKSLTADKIKALMGREESPEPGTIIWAFKQLVKWEEYKKPELTKEREALLTELQKWVELKKL